MANMTLAIPDDLHKVIRAHNEIKWSEIARRAMWEQAKRLEIMDKLVSNSKLKESDVDELDHIVKAGLAKRFSKK